MSSTQDRAKGTVNVAVKVDLITRGTDGNFPFHVHRPSLAHGISCLISCLRSPLILLLSLCCLHKNIMKLSAALRESITLAVQKTPENQVLPRSVADGRKLPKMGYTLAHGNAPPSSTSDRTISPSLTALLPRLPWLF